MIKTDMPIKTIFVGKGVMFERIWRITGYDAKRAEEADRVKHM